MKNLTALRKAKGLTQADVAKAIGVSVAAYGFYETDRRQANYETLNLLARYFNTSVDYLLDRTDLTTPPIQWTDEEKAAGVGAHGTVLSDEEWEIIELFSELERIKGKNAVNAVKTMIKSLCEEK